MEFNGTFFAAIISFLAFVFIMNKLLYEPIRRIVNERNDFINGNYQCASSNNSKADDLAHERDEKLVAAKEDARGKYNEILTGFKSQRSDKLQEAQKESHEEIERAYTDLNNVSNEAKESLKWKMTDLANDIVEKVLGYRSEVQGFNNDKVNEILYNEKG